MCIRDRTSILTSVAPIEWKNTKINIIDTPGLFDFEGGVAEGMRADVYKRQDLHFSLLSEMIS